MADISSAGWMLVTTTRPRLAASASASPSTSPLPTPMVMMTLFGHRAPGELAGRAAAPRPSRRAVCVAPNSIAFSRLNSTGSMATIALGAGEPGALDGVGADAADADDGDGVAGLHLGGVHRRAPAGDDAAAEQAGPVERDVVVDLDAARLVDDRVVGERAEQAHECRGPAPLAWWRDVPSAICMPRPSSGAEVAQVLMAGRAARAPAAGRDEAEHDVVAGLQPADARRRPPARRRRPRGRR